MNSKISQCQEQDIEALSDWLEFLWIIEEASEWTTEYEDEMLTILVEQNNGQTGLSKNMVPNSG